MAEVMCVCVLTCTDMYMYVCKVMQSSFDHGDVSHTATKLICVCMHLRKSPDVCFMYIYMPCCAQTIDIH